VQYERGKMETTIKRTPMPLIGGILAIISGGFKILGMLGLISFSFLAIAPPAIGGVGPLLVFLVIFIPLIILVILSILGGIYAIQRKHFGLALTGSIAALLPFSFLGLASIILVALSKEEFEKN
jgi:hypothetical protein